MTIPGESDESDEEIEGDSPFLKEENSDEGIIDLDEI